MREQLGQRAEALGLLALISYAESRRDARRGPEGAYVPLEDQDVTLWDHDLILEGEKALWIASKHGPSGRYQLEASIQSVHAHRARSGTTDWPLIHALHRSLSTWFPSVGATIGFAASHGFVGTPDEGLALLDALPEDRVIGHQPYWAVRAHLERAAGRTEAARGSYVRAIGLTEDPAVRTWLMGERGSLE